MSLRKGFIGPLGDDIPSIFPIVFAVLLFVGTILYANQIISEKSRVLETREGALALSYIVTEKGFTDNTTLEKSCGQKVDARAASLNVKYLITLKRFCDGIPIDPENEADRNLNPYLTKKSSPFHVANSTAPGETWIYCTNDPGVQSFAEHPAGDAILPQPRQSVVMSFPVAVSCPGVDSYTNGLGVVNVITWK